MRWNRMLLGLAIATCMAGPASALGIQISGPASADVDDVVTFIVGLDEAPFITGYELFASWDDTVLEYQPRLDGGGGVLGNLFVSNALPFTTPNESQLPAGPTNARFSFLFLSALPASQLFELDFKVLPGAVADGIDFFINLAAGGGVSGAVGTGLLDLAATAGVAVNPGSVLFEYSQGDIQGLGGPDSVVPEPSVLALAFAGLVGLGAIGRRR